MSERQTGRDRRGAEIRLPSRPPSRLRDRGRRGRREPQPAQRLLQGHRRWRRGRGLDGRRRPQFAEGSGQVVHLLDGDLAADQLGRAPPARAQGDVRGLVGLVGEVLDLQVGDRRLRRGARRDAGDRRDRRPAAGEDRRRGVARRRGGEHVVGRGGPAPQALGIDPRRRRSPDPGRDPRDQQRLGAEEDPVEQQVDRAGGAVGVPRRLAELLRPARLAAEHDVTGEAGQAAHLLDDRDHHRSLRHHVRQIAQLPESGVVDEGQRDADEPADPRVAAAAQPDGRPDHPEDRQAEHHRRDQVQIEPRLGDRQQERHHGRDGHPRRQHRRESEQVHPTARPVAIRRLLEGVDSLVDHGGPSGRFLRGYAGSFSRPYRSTWRANRSSYAEAFEGSGSTTRSMATMASAAASKSG